MNSRENNIHGLLMHLFQNLVKIEEEALAKSEFSDISITDMNNIEAIGYETARNMSSVARDLDITVGTLTISINNLVKKGYVSRVRSSKDRRVVLISLSPKGQKAYKYHKSFNEDIIDQLRKYLDADEQEVLVKSLEGLQSFVNQKRIKKQ